MIVSYGIERPDVFLTSGTFHTIFGSQQALVFLSVALVVVFTVGEFDLSVASMLGLSATLVPVLYTNYGWPLWLSIVTAFAATTFAGVANGFLIVVVRVNPIIATLGSGTLMLGIALGLADLQTVAGLPLSLGDVALTDVLGLPVSFFYGLALVLLLAYILRFTPLGRQMVTVGANREVARLAGIRVDRIRFGAYVTSGALCGLGGIILVSGLGGFDPASSQTYLLPAFAAVFLGTAVVQPGRFNPIGSFIAIYFLATGITGLQIMGIAGWIADVFYGSALIIAVSVSALIRRHQLGS